MVREITIGQYYPGDSILHKLAPQGQNRMYPDIPDLAVCSEQCDRISAGNHFSGGSDYIVKSAGILYYTRIETSFDFIALYGSDESVLYTRGCRAGSFLGFYHYRKGTSYSSLYVNPPDLSDRRIFSDDIYHDPKCIDRWD